jgi:hypothetical protein
VESPYRLEKMDRVERVTDTLTSMFNRKQLTQLQFAAGDRYRMSWEMTSASSGGSMDFDRVRGRSGPSMGFADTYLSAADDVHQVKLKLNNPKTYAMIHRVCVVGLTIEQAARQLHDPKWDRRWKTYLKEATFRFHTGLDDMAEKWWPDSRTQRDPKTGEEIRAMRNIRTEKAAVTNAPPPERGASRVAHATRDKVYRGNNNTTNRKERA